jgi:predicted nuclease with RNAse H fold
MSLPKRIPASIHEEIADVVRVIVDVCATAYENGRIDASKVCLTGLEMSTIVRVIVNVCAAAYEQGEADALTEGRRGTLLQAATDREILDEMKRRGWNPRWDLKDTQ